MAFNIKELEKLDNDSFSEIIDRIDEPKKILDLCSTSKLIQEKCNKIGVWFRFVEKILGRKLTKISGINYRLVFKQIIIAWQDDLNIPVGNSDELLKFFFKQKEIREKDYISKVIRVNFDHVIDLRRNSLMFIPSIKVLFIKLERYKNYFKYIDNDVCGNLKRKINKFLKQIDYKDLMFVANRLKPENYKKYLDYLTCSKPEFNTIDNKWMGINPIYGN